MTNCTRCDKKFGFFSTSPFIWQDKPVCEECYDYFINEKEVNSINQGILWQRNEKSLGSVKCTLCFGIFTGNFNANYGYLILTNQRIIFATKRGYGSVFSVMYTISLEDVAAVSPIGKKQLEVVDKGNNKIEFIQMTTQSIIPIISSAVNQRKNQLLAEKQQERFQIVLDFSSLKDVMAKGGLVMSTYKCPNCNGMINIPEDGKVLMCQYCGTPIKPVDIFEKIKSLIT
jgi:hypothetical protein